MKIPDTKTTVLSLVSLLVGVIALVSPRDRPLIVGVFALLLITQYLADLQSMMNNNTEEIEKLKEKINIQRDLINIKADVMNIKKKVFKNE